MELTVSEAQDELRAACHHVDLERISQLFANAPLDAGDAMYSLKNARMGMNPALIRVLLQNGADLSVIHIRNIPHSRHVSEFLELLDEHKYDFKSDGHRILQDFARDRETLDWLLDQGVDNNRTDTARLDNGFNLYPGGTDSSLHLLNKVAAHGDIELFDHLVSRGADDSLSTALHSASWCRDTDLSVAMARHLLDKHHMDVNSNNEDFRNFFHDAHDTGTPLCSAVLNRNLAVILLLLERGASPKDPDMRPISYALKDDGFLPAIEALLRASIDPTSALKKAVGYQNLAAANICIELGADPTSALDKAFKHEEQRVQRVARAEASDESRTESEYEEVLEKRATAERISEAMIELLRSSVNDNAHFR